MKPLILILIALSASAQTRDINPKKITIVSADVDAAFNAFAPGITDPDATVTMTLTNAIDAAATAVRVSNGSDPLLRVGTAIKIGNEVMLVTAKAGRDLTVTRAFMGTTAAASEKDVPVQILRHATLEDLARNAAIDVLRAIVKASGLNDIKASEAALAATRKTREASAVNP